MKTLPRNILHGLPFPPLIVIDQDNAIDQILIDELVDSKGEREGVSLLLRSENGHLKRGGYYFHFQLSDKNLGFYNLFNFENEQVAELSKSDLVLLINHCSGREYSDKSYKVCQHTINMRDDP